MNNEKFQLGKVVQTRAVCDLAAENHSFAKDIQKAFAKYMKGDWGETCEEDKELNNSAIKGGDRILAKYATCLKDIFIITEYDRSYTTILFCDEY